jgi:hypothetical protein
MGLRGGGSSRAVRVGSISRLTSVPPGWLSGVLAGGGESGWVSGGQDVAIVVDVDVNDVLVADQAGDGRVGWMRHEVVGGGDLA